MGGSFRQLPCMLNMAEGCLFGNIIPTQVALPCTTTRRLVHAAPIERYCTSSDYASVSRLQHVLNSQCEKFRTGSCDALVLQFAQCIFLAVHPCCVPGVDVIQPWGPWNGCCTTMRQETAHLLAWLAMRALYYPLLLPCSAGL